MKFLKFFGFGYVCLLLMISIFAGCADTRLDWDHVLATKELRFATIESPATYYESPVGPAGFEYELAKRFADSIGVKLKLITANHSGEIMNMVMDNKVTIGGAALVSFDQTGLLKSGPAYFSVPHQLVYRRGNARPASVSDVSKQNPVISLMHLGMLKEQYPQVDWNIYYEGDFDTLLRKVQHREITSTVANAQQINIYKHLYPDIRVAFDITQPQPLAWLYRDGDKKLNEVVMGFFKEMENSGNLNRLIERYFGHVIAFNYIDTSTFLTRIEERLPEFEQLFRETAARYDFDWTLLAAISYQESHWQPSAKSPTGVRGLMMLTKDTAQYLGVTDRVNPEQSVDGGARYFKYLLSKIPDRIPSPDNTLLALAAYNIGLQNLEHARVITQRNGGNPDRWSEVSKSFINLGKENSQPLQQSEPVRWNEPVQYVRNIRKYRDILRWLTFEKSRQARKNERLHALSIDSPVL